MFVTNNLDLCKRTLNFVRHISVPKSHSMLGIHPILSIMCHTDQGSLIIEKLSSLKLSESEKESIISVVKYCTSSSIYPHDKTVWAFNDSQHEIVSLKSYLDGETKELESVIRLHSDTYPFIAVEEHFTDLPVCRHIEENQMMRTNLSRPHVKKELPLRENEYSHRTAPTALVPTLALGSLYMLSKLASKD